MDHAVAPLAPQPLVPLPAGRAGFAQRLQALPARSLLALSSGAALLVALLVALALWSGRTDWRVLFAGLSDKDGGAVIAQLAQLNVPYRNGDGNAILVPADRVHEVRLRLASAGLPKGTVGGYELMDNARFGQTQFQERLTFQRGLEGELVRSIGSLAAVQSARVHLALPNQNGFFREQQKPSASVLLTLHPGRTLDPAQVAGIVHLVSASVPELSPKAVSVIDASGTLLSAGDDDGRGGLDAQQLQYVQQVEAAYVKRVLDILEPVVGRANLRANVTADIDFSQTESTSEEYKPNQGDAAAAVKLRQVNESTSPGAVLPSGVPGAASNQPPVPATAPLTGAAPPLQAAQGGSSGGSARRDAVTHYEVDKTVRVTRNATGTVRRLNAAVVVNHRSSTDAKGKTTTTPLSTEEMDKLTALVKQSLGFNAERGDSVRVINAPFRVEPAPALDEAPIYRQPWLLDLLRSAAAPLLLAAVALVVALKLVRPALQALIAPPAPPPGTHLDVVAGGDGRAGGALPAPAAAAAAGAPVLALTGPQMEAKLDHARAFAKEHPAAVAQIVKGWVSGEGA